MKKRKKKSNHRKFLLETSVQIEKFKSPGLKNELQKLSSSSSLFSSYFILYEFKVGLIKSLIDFYSLVNIEDSISDAFSIWSNKFATRELKNVIVMMSLISRQFEDFELKDKVRCLNKIEATIFHLINNFETDITSLVGDFGSDEIVKFEILDKSDYPGFMEKYSERKCILLENFWEKHSEELKQLVSNRRIFNRNKTLRNMHKALEETFKDLKSSYKFRVNKILGDPVIAVDTPSSMTITTLDLSFEALCFILSKNYLPFKEKTTSKVVKFSSQPD